MKSDEKFLTKCGLVSLVAKRTGKKQSEVGFIIDTILNAVVDSCVKTGGCDIKGFGKFHTIERKGQSAYNFKTKETLQLEPYKKVKFIPAKIWDMVNREESEIVKHELE